MELKQTNNYPLSKTPLNIFLNQKFDLDNNKQNIKFYDENGVLILKFSKNEEMLVFLFNYFLKVILYN